jgi:hypothetical protein
MIMDYENSKVSRDRDTAAGKKPADEKEKREDG